MQVKSVDHISYAVNDIDKVIEAWSRLYGIGPWTFKENGGKDGKGRPWKIRMAFAYLGPVEIELVQCLGRKNLPVQVYRQVGRRCPSPRFLRGRCRRGSGKIGERRSYTAHP